MLPALALEEGEKILMERQLVVEGYLAELKG